MQVAKRIALLETSGVGKTTVGRELAKRLECFFVEVDAFQHRANWARATPGELAAAIRTQLAAQERWVIDGICEREVGDFVSSQADLIVWSGC